MVWTRFSCARSASRLPRGNCANSATSATTWCNDANSATSATTWCNDADSEASAAYWWNGADQLPAANRGRNGRPPDPLRGLIRGHRMRDEEALDRVAAERGETLTRLRVLDAFGDDRVTEPVTELHGGAHDRRARFVVDHADHERPVDLDLVERQAVEVGERRVPDAEVIERDVHSHRAQRVHRLQRALRVGGEHCFSHLEAQQIRSRIPALQQLGDRLRQLRVVDVAHREVHRDRNA